MPIAFYLNRAATPIHLTPPPDQTVLHYLRQTGHSGTKEGCASGDCGACTAVLATPTAPGALNYTPLNTCIAFMSALHGKLLISVEGLADPPQTLGAPPTLHPVQHGIATHHGAQCGFCTPGFVMALFAMTKHPPASTPKAAHADVATAISGNLCRCTGYRPIIAAGKHLLTPPPPPDYYDQNAAAIATRLRALPPPPQDPPPDDIAIAPDNAAIAAHLRARPGATLLAGGTDLALAVTQQDRPLPPKIDLTRATDLRQITDHSDHWRIGAAVTIAECAAAIAPHIPDLPLLLHRFGSPPIRARATVGGNIANASPIADLPPPFIALGATLLITAADGADRRLPLQDFYLDYKKTALRPDEWITAVLLPKPASDSLIKLYKISKRIDDDISAVSAAFHWRITADRVREARLAFGGMAATPKRAPAAEAAFTDAAWTKNTITAAAAALARDLTPLSDMRASARYRRQIAANLLHRAWHESQHPTPRIQDLA